MRYYVDKRELRNGDHMVHVRECADVPVPEHRLTLGEFESCGDALLRSRHSFFSQSNGCPVCCPTCHLR